MVVWLHGQIPMLVREHVVAVNRHKWEHAPIHHLVVVVTRVIQKNPYYEQYLAILKHAPQVGKMAITKYQEFNYHKLPSSWNNHAKNNYLFKLLLHPNNLNNNLNNNLLTADLSINEKTRKTSVIKDGENLVLIYLFLACSSPRVVLVEGYLIYIFHLLACSYNKPCSCSNVTQYTTGTEPDLTLVHFAGIKPTDLDTARSYLTIWRQDLFNAFCKGKAND